MASVYMKTSIVDSNSEVQMCLATSSDSSNKQFMLLDKLVGFKCLSALLGVGTHRLRKGMASAPDLRHGTRPYMSRPGTWSVDGFLRMAYDSVAETMPDELLRIDSINVLTSQCKSLTKRDVVHNSLQIHFTINNLDELIYCLCTFGFAWIT